MHKKIYVSGFLYHPPSQQILLQQNSSIDNQSSSWFLFGGLCPENKEPEAFFKDVISKLLDIKIGTVYPIYSYLDDATGKHQYTVYSELNKLRKFSSKDGLTFSWFSFKEVLKLKVTAQTKHDIVVGQRVIEAAGRKSRGEHTFQ